MDFADSLTAAFQAALAGQFTLERELGRGGMGITGGHPGAARGGVGGANGGDFVAMIG